MIWLLAATLPLLSWFLWWAWRKKQQLVAQFVQSRLLAQLTVGVSQLRQKVRLVLLMLAVACALLALARPQWGFDWEEAKQRGLDIVVAIDTSRSMLAEDMRPNRLTRAKLASLDLMKLATHDRLALVPFAGTAFLQCPLTLDEDAYRQSVEALDVGIIPQGGTALTEAIDTALAAFKEGNDNHKILVLFTDGEDHDSGAAEAAKKAAQAGMKIFTVGIGTPNGELLRVTDENGTMSYIKDDQGNVVKSRLNEELLREIATDTGGFYLPLQGANAMETLYKEGLAPLPKSETSARLVKRYHERFQWPLALAVLALLFEMFLPEQKRVRRSEAIVNTPNAELRKAVAALLVLAIPLAVSASPSSAKRLYDERKFEQSRQEYESLLKKSSDVNWQALEETLLKRTDEKQDGGNEQFVRSLQKANLGDPRLHFNAGAAAYNTGDLEKAETHFMLAMVSPDLKLQQHAFYNLGNTFYRLGEQNPEVNSKIAQWEKAVHSYEGAVQLDSQDADAKYNRDLVKKKLEELKKQQPKQQEQKQENQKQDKQDQKKDQQKQDQQQKQQSDSAKQQSQKQEQKSKPDSKPQDQKSDDQQENASNQKQKEQEQAKQNKPQGASKGDEKPGDQTEANAASTPGQMTVQEAQQLLDAHKGEERAMIFVPAQKLKEQKRIFKDW